MRFTFRRGVNGIALSAYLYLGEHMLQKFLSRKFLMTVAALVTSVLGYDVSAIVSGAYVFGEAIVDAVREWRKK